MLGNVSVNSPGPMSPSSKVDKLPAIPPSHHFDNAAPPPPPKTTTNHESATPQYANHRPPPIDTSSTLSPHTGIDIAPITPISPIGLGPVSSTANGDGQSKRKANPLTDLVETERVYVDLLTGIIRKVASAWSRQNLPPPELDKMFRSIESVYKANRSLLSKLKDIGTDPSSLKTLGDLLMKWIGDLEAPYTKYTNNYCSGYDNWEPVQSNERLRTTLAMFSASNPPPAAEEHPSQPPLWTLDALFLLPKYRLRYYRKLYSRLMKSTTPGRSDHKLLTSAIDKLDGLLSTLDDRANVRVDGGVQPPPEVEDEVVIDMRMRDSTLAPPPSQRASDSTHGSSSPSVSRSSQDTAPTSVGRESTSTMSMPITDLERRLSTDRTLDIFTMQPKQVRLQITPPSLHYTRELRMSIDVVLNFIPRSTGVEITQESGHIFLLTDLLLICERMTPQELARSGPDGADMWLLYPPLAGKHLRVGPAEGSDSALAVTILRKETVIMSCESRSMRDKLLEEFRDCIDRAALLQGGKNQPPPPPVPQLPPMSNMPSSPAHSRSQPAPQDASSAPNSPPSRALSPSSISSGERSMPPPIQGMTRMALSEEVSSPPQRMGSLNAQNNFPPRSSSAAQPGGPGGPSFSVGQVLPPGPGQIMPPGSFGPGQIMHAPSSFGPGQVMQPSVGPGQVMGPPRGTSFRPPGGPGGPGGHMQPGPMQPGLPLPPHPSSYNRSVSPYSQPASRPPSDGSSGPLRKSSSSNQLNSQYPNDLLPPNRPFMHRNDSSGSLSSLGSNMMQAPQPRTLLPSATFNVRSTSTNSFIDPSPPSSPVQETPRFTGPTTSSISAQMKCKVFLQEHHAKWKSLGSARLKVYHESPTNIKQLVVEAESGKNGPMISTIVLADGVERVGKTGVAITLSDKGQRTGIVYMIQLRNETSAGGLFESLLAGSDRAGPKRT
ncbi:hypothetical protein BDW22DRAFT_1385910 [Trametopsis cervina]|nr:hypothetical protein BDW22DRAFT_1385910 [Trametopsis cervina]